MSALSQGVLTIVKAAAAGAHIPPSVMHSAQDAIAAIYSFLQQHGTFLGQAGAPGKQAVCSAADAMIASLQVSLSLSACCKNPCLHAHRRCHSCDRQSGLSLLLTRRNLCIGCRACSIPGNLQGLYCRSSDKAGRLSAATPLGVARYINRQ